MPLVIVPAALVAVLAGVVLAFGMLTGRERTPGENVERLLHGGAHERDQAAFALVGQVLAADRAAGAEGGGGWGIDPELRDGLRAAREERGAPRGADEVPLTLTLTILLAHLGDGEAIDALAELTRLPDELDPGGEYRLFAASVLGSLGGELGDARRDRAAAAMIALLDGQDTFLRTVAAAALARLPSADTVPALRGLLDAPAVELRHTAALSLAGLGDDSGVAVLRAMCTRAPYDAERAADPAKWGPERVGEARCKALLALDSLGRGPGRTELEALARDGDGEVRALARRLLARSPEPAAGD